MKIKHVEEKDFDASLKLDAFAFQTEIPDDSREKIKEQLRWESIIGMYDGETMAAKLSVLPLATYINGKRHLMGGIGSVATWPEYRRQGIVKKLMKQALLEMWKKGQNISFLHPFSYGFYRKFGWELAFSEKKYTIPVERFRQHWDGKGYVKSYRHDMDALHHIYTTYARHFNGMLTREQFVWKNWVIKEHQQLVIAYRDDGKPEGYIIYKVENDILAVKEFAYTSLNGRKLILEFIGNHDSMAEKVTLSVPENDQLDLLLNEPQMKQSTEAHMMARIVNVDAFLKTYTFNTEQNRAVSIHITDDFLPENTGVYTIRMNDGEATVTMVKHQSGTKAGIRCNVQELTLMLIGYSRPGSLQEMGRVAGTSDAITNLETLLPHMQTFLIDEF